MDEKRGEEKKAGNKVVISFLSDSICNVKGGRRRSPGGRCQAQGGRRQAQRGGDLIIFSGRECLLQ